MRGADNCPSSLTWTQDTIDQTVKVEITPLGGDTFITQPPCLSFNLQVDEQLALLQHEKVDLLKRLEEDQEDLNELMKKHKALIAQVLLLASVCLSSSINHLIILKLNVSLSLV